MASNSAKSNDVQSVEGPTRDACMAKLYDMYGTNFQTVNCSTKLKPGFLGFFQKEYVVLQYQVTNRSMNQPQMPGMQSYAQNIQPQYASGIGNVTGMNRVVQPVGAQQNLSQYQISNILQELQQSKSNPQELFLKNRDELLKNAGTSVSSSQQIGNLSKQLEQFQKEMKEQMQSIAQSSGTPSVHKNIVRIQEILEENDFTKSYIKKISSRMKNEFSLDELDDFAFVQKKVVTWIAESIPFYDGDDMTPPSFVIIVGPTGVGKTTTVSKMASRIMIDFKHNREKYNSKPRVRMITTDAMRVAAVEQLSSCAEILGVRVDKAESYDDFKTLCDSYSSNSDYIFVDTSGYSPNDYENIGRMRQVLNVKNSNENIFLAVTAGVSAKDLDNIIRNYEVFNFKSVIITKCDETTSFGRVISVLSEKKKPVSWLTTGQYFTDMIQRADAAWFLKNLTGFSKEVVEECLKNADKELDS